MDGLKVNKKYTKEKKEQKKKREKDLRRKFKTAAYKIVPHAIQHTLKKDSFSLIYCSILFIFGKHKFIVLQIFMVKMNRMKKKKIFKTRTVLKMDI